MMRVPRAAFKSYVAKSRHVLSGWNRTVWQAVFLRYDEEMRVKCLRHPEEN